MSQQHKIGSHKTAIFTDSQGFVNIVYHNTAVVKFSIAEKKIYLNSGGWLTATTKARMNQTFNQYGLPLSVFQKNFDWYVKHETKNYTIPFKDNMLFRY